MKNRLIVILIFTNVLFMATLTFCYLFVPRIDIDTNDIYLNYNENFNFKDKYAKYRNQKIKLDEKDNVNTKKLGNYSVVYSTNIKNSINKVKRIYVHVADLESPKIILNGKDEETINYNENYKEEGFKATDNYDGDLTSKVIVKSNVEDKVIGNYTIEYTVIDSSNNITKVERKIIVKDTENPIIKLNRNTNSYLILNKSININDFTATDNYDGDLTNKVKVTGEVNNKKEGLYKVTYTVSDNNNNTEVLDTWINVQKKNTSGVPVLMYHWFYDDTKGETYSKVNGHDYMSKTNFESEIKYLVDNNYYFPAYEELEKYIDGKISLPKKSIILTSDDGKESFYNIAGEVIEKYKVPMTSFVITKNNNWKKHTDNKYIVFESHSDNLHNRGCKGDMNGDMMCKKESYILNDLTLSRKKLGDNPKVFAYPYGHYKDESFDEVKKSGFDLAFTINYGKVKKGMNKLKLPRIRINRTTTLTQYKNMIK